MMLSQSFLEPIVLLPSLVIGAVFFLSVLLHACGTLPWMERVKRYLTIKGLIRVVVYFRVGYAGLFTVLQYFAWTEGGKMSAALARASLGGDIPVTFVKMFPFVFGGEFGYFIYYSLSRFWLGAALSLFGAWIFYRFLLALERHQGRFFEEGETELGYLSALLVGWPLAVLFIPLSFACVVLLSLIRLIFLKEPYTTLGWPFLAATLISLVWGGTLLVLTGLLVLRV